MPASFEPIATITSSATSSVTFSNIPQTFVDLFLVNEGTAASTAFDAFVRFNGDSGSNYSMCNIYGTGTGGSSQRETNATYLRIDKQATWRSGNRTMNQVHIFNYANTATFKNILSESDASTDVVEALTGCWRNANAITSITVGTDTSANFASGTTFTLYGIRGA